MPLANVTIKTKQMPFPPETVPGLWGWALVETDGVAGPEVDEGEPIIWSSIEPYTSVEVESGKTYKVSGARFNDKGTSLGGTVSALFTTESEPVEVIVDVADVIYVELN